MSVSRSSGGSEFHTVGADKQKGLEPSLAVRVRGTTSWCCTVDLKRALPGTTETGTQCCDKNRGARPCYRELSVSVSTITLVWKNPNTNPRSIGIFSAGIQQVGYLLSLCISPVFIKCTVFRDEGGNSPEKLLQF